MQKIWGLSSWRLVKLLETSIEIYSCERLIIL